MSTRAVYLDHAATTPLDPRALESMLPYFGPAFGNAGSRLYRRGLEAEEAVEEARRRVAGLIGARPVEITFTGGATESNNIALQGLAKGWGPRKTRLIYSEIEHPSILEQIGPLRDAGVQCIGLPVDSDGRVRLDALEDLLSVPSPPRLNTLVTVMHANNELGTVQPVAAIGRLCREHDAVFHCDASQSVGKIPVDVGVMGADLLSLSAHKFYGPMGVGALYVRRSKPRLPVKPLVFGGGQERNLRPGTLNVPSLVGLGAAAQLAGRSLAEEGDRLGRQIDSLLSRLRHLVGGFEINGSEVHRLPGSVNLSFVGVAAEDLQQAVKNQLELSAGSACATGKVGPSHVIRALGLSRERGEGAFRLAIGRNTTDADVERAARLLASAVGKLRSRSLDAEPVSMP